MDHISPLLPAGEPRTMLPMHCVPHAFLVGIDFEAGVVEVEIPARRLKYHAPQLRVMNGVRVGGHVGLLALDEGQLSVAPMDGRASGLAGLLDVEADDAARAL